MSWGAVLAAGAGTALVVAPTWRVSRGWVTLAHEVGHALAAIVAEGRVRRIRVELDTSGVTEWSGASVRRRIPRGFVAWWGYPAPGTGAVLLGVAVRTGHEVVALAVLGLVALVVLAVWIRSAWGAALTIVLAAAAGAGAASGDDVAAAVAVGIAAVWAVGGVRAAASAAPRTRRGDGSDQATLAQVLWLPVGFWSATMVVMAAATTLATAVLVAPTITG
ncbi:MAG TPA: M50 family metallopeptidase [Iamia sp.]|nr:M50 family metallopeptidase [Iamia sp.]